MKKKMIDIIALSFSVVVGISVLFAVLLHSNLYYSFISLQPAIITIVIFAFEWLAIDYFTLSALMVAMFLSFVTIATIFAEKYMNFHYKEEEQDVKKSKPKKAEAK